MSANGVKSRADYRYFRPVESRWNDNDIYGHVNNVVFRFDAIDVGRGEGESRRGEDQGEGEGAFEERLH